MKKLLALLFTFAILYSSSSYSNILDDLLSGMSPADIELYEKSFTDVGFKPKNAALGNYVPSSNFQAKIKNLNQEKSAKQIYIRIKTLDCNKGCKNCIEVDEAVYEVLEVKEFDFDISSLTSRARKTILRPNNTYKININITDATGFNTYVQKSGNETCFSTSISKVNSLNIFD